MVQRIPSERPVAQQGLPPPFNFTAASLTPSAAIRSPVAQQGMSPQLNPGAAPFCSHSRQSSDQFRPRLPEQMATPPSPQALLRHGPQNELYAFPPLSDQTPYAPIGKLQQVTMQSPVRPSLFWNQLPWKMEGNLMSEQPARAAQSVVCRVKMLDNMRLSNLRHMFPTGEVIKIQDEFGYVRFSTLKGAKESCDRFIPGLSIQLNVALTDTSTSAPPHAASQSSCTSAASTSTSGTTLTSAMLDKLLAAAAMYELHKQEGINGHLLLSVLGLRPLTLYAEETAKNFAEEFTFDVAVRYGSVGKDIYMAWCTPFGSRVFTGLSWYIGQFHLVGLSWGGHFTLKNLFISLTELLAIGLVPKEQATQVNMSKDFTTLVSELAPLYKIRGKLPPHFDEMIRSLEDLPPRVAGNLEELHFFFEQLLNKPCFATPERQHSLLEAFHINHKNLHWDDKAAFSIIAPIEPNWAVIAQTDFLLQRLIENGRKTLFRGFDDQVHHVWHCYAHLSDIIAYLSEYHEDFPLKERFMLAALYYKDCLPKLVNFLFKEVRKEMQEAGERKRWLIEVLGSYKKETTEFAALPLGLISFDIEPDMTLLGSAVQEDDCLGKNGSSDDYKGAMDTGKIGPSSDDKTYTI